MRLNIEDILAESGMSKSVEFEFYSKDVGIVSDDCEFDAPMTLHAEVSNLNRIIRVKGKVDMAYRTFCARCLGVIVRETTVEIDEEYVQAGYSPEDGMCTYEGKSIELDGVIHDAVLLKLPIRHLCKEDCMSLCPVCGKDLNYGDCGCESAVFNEQFSVLRSYFKENDNYE